MNKKLEALKKQQAEIAAAIAKAELAEKNRARVEKAVLKVIAKHPDLYLLDVAKLEKALDDALAGIVGNLENRN